jgi:flagellar protein FliO/FliZ
VGWVGEFFQVLAALIVVIVIFFLAWYIPHLIAKKGSFASKGKNIAILEKIPVSKDSYIMLLKAFDKIVLVGVTPGGMTTLKELEDGDYSPEDIQPGAQSFSQVFKTVLSNTIPEGRIKKAFDKLAGRKKGDGGDDE